MPLRSIGVALGLVAILGIAAVTPATAEKPRIRSSATIDHEESQSGHRFFGTVSSRKRKCVRRRLVTLYSDDEFFGTQQVGEPVLSDTDGDWEVQTPGNFLSGDFYVTVDRKPKKRVVCKRTESERITLD